VHIAWWLTVRALYGVVPNKQVFDIQGNECVAMHTGHTDSIRCVVHVPQKNEVCERASERFQAPFPDTPLGIHTVYGRVHMAWRV
jgi:hypothetical protein